MCERAGVRQNQHEHANTLRVRVRVVRVRVEVQGTVPCASRSSRKPSNVQFSGMRSSAQQLGSEYVTCGDKRMLQRVHLEASQ